MKDVYIMLLLAALVALLVAIFITTDPTHLQRVCRNKSVYLVDGKFYQCIEVKPVAVQGVNKNEQ